MSLAEFLASPAARRLACAALFVGALALPWLAPDRLPDYRLFSLTLAAIWGIAVLGLSILAGLSGQISLGHGAFYGLGGYLAALAPAQLGISVYWTLPIAVAVCYAAGRAFGRVAAGQGIWNQALATFALAIAFPQMLRWRPIEGWTGGTQGAYVEQPGAPDWSGIGDAHWWYLLAVTLLALGMVAAANLRRSRSGRALAAVRDNEIAAAAQGVDVARHRAVAFGISAAYVGLAGCLAAIQIGYVAPGAYGVTVSLQFLVGAVVGGINSVAGAVLGGLFLQFFPDLVAWLGKGLSAVLYAAILIAVIVAVPDGIAGLAARLTGRLRPGAWGARGLERKRPPLGRPL